MKNHKKKMRYPVVDDHSHLDHQKHILEMEGVPNQDNFIDDRVVVWDDSQGFFVSTAVSITELELLNGMTAVETGVANNDKLVTQGYVDDIYNISGLTDDYLPFWDSASTGLLDSPISTDGTDISLGDADINDVGTIDLNNQILMKYNGSNFFQYWPASYSIAIGLYAGADENYSTYMGYYAGESNTGERFSGFGRDCGRGNSGTYFSGVGHQCGRSNSGNFFSGVGALAGYQNDSIGCTPLGYASGFQQSGTYFSGLGYTSGYLNEGDYFAGIGYNCGRQNKGLLFLGMGRECGRYNSANYFCGQGGFCGYLNNGDSFTGIGFEAGYKNDADRIIALGGESFQNFDVDAAKEETFDYTDIDVGNNRVTVTGHSFGSSGYINLLYTEGTGAIGGFTDGAIEQWKVVDANTMECISDNISSAGTGTGHKLSARVKYTESIAFGYQSEPDAAYQVMLGNSNTTMVKTEGEFRTEDGVLTIAETTTPTAVTDYGKIYTKNDNKLYFQDGAGTEHEIAFV